MGTKTGGHWRPCNVGSVEAHNERQQEYLESVKNSGRNLYFFEHLTKNNSSWVNQSERYLGKTVEEIQEEQKNRYEEKFGQKPQMAVKKRVNKKTGRETTVSGWSPIREMCPPIKADTKIEDFDYFRQWAERHRLNILRIDLHKDEGYYDEETGEYKMNYHAHVVGDFFDWETGKTIKLGKEVMSEMQTILAISLGMERGERKGADSPNAMTHPEYRKMMELVDEMRKDLKDMAKKEKKEQAVLDAIRVEVKKEETKLKSFTSMLKNLKDQKEHLEIDIAALEEIGDTAEKELQEKKRQLDEINDKISTREKQLGETNRQLESVREEMKIVKNELQDLNRQKKETEQKIKAMIDEGLERYDNLNKKIKERHDDAVKRIKEIDKSGIIERKQQQVNARDTVVNAIWPKAQSAIEAIVHRASHPVDSFTIDQAAAINSALNSYPQDRDSAAHALMGLAQRDFDERMLHFGFIEETAQEVRKIARHIHPILALLGQGRSNNDGSASYITDLTDWAGNQIKR